MRVAPAVVIEESIRRKLQQYARGPDGRMAVTGHRYARRATGRFEAEALLGKLLNQAGASLLVPRRSAPSFIYE